ncbi:MAG: hypothetical protein KJ709_01490 [Nanoarchaeota archaeon]|nr:hypothetical protein [Nanoarchaeota archaeon]
MEFDRHSTAEKVGEKIGFLTAYFFITTGVFLIFMLLKKIPESWGYLHFMGVIFVIAAIGIIIQRLLK